MTPSPKTQGDLAAFLAELWQPRHFYMANGLQLAWQFETEQTLPWEIFRGRLLEPEQTREERRFLAWNVFQVVDRTPAPDPMLSLLLDAPSGMLHVTRGILCHVWRPTTRGNIIETEETTRWVRELVGSVRLAEFPWAEALRDELVSLLWHAVVGTSRLPLQSLEAPLPAYSLGQLAYVYQGAHAGGALDQPLRHWPELIVDVWPLEMSERERGKLLETLLRSATKESLSDLAALLGDDVRLPRLMRVLFNNVSLSPYTDFVEHALAFLRDLVAQGHWDAARELDLLCHLVRLEYRHLNAYDLVIFHHRGANFPDALLLDAVLTRLLDLAAAAPALFTASAARRQALLLACMLRQQYEGLPVPAQPTSPGENARVMPWPRVPEEEIVETTRRRRRLFEERPLAGLVAADVRSLLAIALADLGDAARRRELGMALFIDRPLGYGKPPVERDQTPLVAHECFSPSLLRRRLADTGRLAADLGIHADGADSDTPVPGTPVQCLLPDSRPCASLADACKVASDFVVVRTMPHGLRALFACFAWEGAAPPDFLEAGANHALLHFAEGGTHRRLTLLSDKGRRFEIALDLSEGWTERAGIELPRAGLAVAWEGGQARLRRRSS